MKYDEDFLSEVSKRIGFYPKITNKTNFEVKNWWGALEDTNLEKKLNNKKYAVELSKKLNIDKLNTQLIQNKQEASIYLEKEKEIFMRDLYLFSGMGSKKISRQMNTEFKFPVIFSKYELKKLDLSTIFLRGKTPVTIMSLTTKTGRYAGNLLFSNDTNYETELRNYLGELRYNNFQKERDQINEYIFKNEKVDFIQMDSLVSQNCVHTLIEFNYRNTIGCITYQISKKLKKFEFALFIILKPNENIADYNIKGWKEKIRLSPGNKKFNTFYLIFDYNKFVPSQILSTVYENFN